MQRLGEQVLDSYTTIQIKNINVEDKKRKGINAFKHTGADKSLKKKI